jgi:hypothetical protein
LRSWIDAGWAASGTQGGGARSGERRERWREGGEDEAGASVGEREWREEAPEGVLGGEEEVFVVGEPEEEESGERRERRERTRVATH